MQTSGLNIKAQFGINTKLNSHKKYNTLSKFKEILQERTFIPLFINFFNSDFFSVMILIYFLNTL